MTQTDHIVRAQQGVKIVSQFIYRNDCASLQKFAHFKKPQGSIVLGMHHLSIQLFWIWRSSTHNKTTREDLGLP